MRLVCSLTFSYRSGFNEINLFDLRCSLAYGCFGGLKSFRPLSVWTHTLFFLVCLSNDIWHFFIYLIQILVGKKRCLVDCLKLLWITAWTKLAMLFPKKSFDLNFFRLHFSFLIVFAISGLYLQFALCCFTCLKKNK